MASNMACDKPLKVPHAGCRLRPRRRILIRRGLYDGAPTSQLHALKLKSLNASSKQSQAHPPLVGAVCVQRSFTNKVGGHRRGGEGEEKGGQQAQEVPTNALNQS